MTGPRFSGATYEAEHDQERLAAQLDRVKALMLDGAWRTLDDISAITKDPPASISARLRDLRKPRFGSYVVERETIGSRKAGLFSYRVRLPDGDENRRRQIPDKATMQAALLDLRELVRIGQRAGRQPSKELVEVGRWMAERVEGDFQQRGGRQ